MKILITGAKGYIGTHVVEWVGRNTEHEVVAVDIAPSHSFGRVTYLEMDILSRAKDAALYGELGRPDIIIHLAWKDGFKHNSDAHLEFLNAHFQFLRNMYESGCKNISAMGTMHEVGYYEGMIDDKNPPPCNPMSPYGIAKNALRQAMFTYVRDKDVSLKWLRAFYITGDEARAASIFAKISQMESLGQETFPFTDGKARYDFIDVDKLAEMIIKASLKTGVKEIINVCSGVPVALKDKVESFIKEKSYKIRPEYGKFPTRAYDSSLVYGSNKRIMEILAE